MVIILKQGQLNLAKTATAEERKAAGKTSEYLQEARKMAWTPKPGIVKDVTLMESLCQQSYLKRFKQ